MNTPPPKQRLVFIDALRGLAVLLMMEQNMGIWLWKADGPMRFSSHPILFTINGMGGFAGPLFITLAGISAALFVQRHSQGDRTLISRGIGIMLFGYLMNFLAPGFLSMGSWFTLHMIGFGILLTPLFRRMPISFILLLIGTILFGTGLLHYYLETPRSLSQYHMTRLDQPGGMFRLMFVEGHYAVFPWLAFYLFGVVTGRLYLEDNQKQIITIALVSLSISAFCLIPEFITVSFNNHRFWLLFLRLNLGSFPTPPLFVLLFYPLVAFLFLTFKPLTQQIKVTNRHFLVCLGRISLTLQIVHVVIFYEIFQRLRWFRTFSTLETLCMVLGVLALTAFLSTRWRKIHYRFSCEWTLRRITDNRMEGGDVAKANGQMEDRADGVLSILTVNSQTGEE